MKKFLSFAEQGFTVLSLLLYSGGPLTVILSGGASEGVKEYVVTANYPLIQLLFLLVYVVTFFLLVKQWKKVLYVFNENRFIWLLLSIAVVSVLWSYAPAMTIRRGVALVGTTLFGVYLATRYSTKQQLQILAWTFGVATLLSLMFALALPKYGIMDGIHAGAWRGIYIHKNVLGRVTVLSAAIFLLLAIDTQRNRLLLWCGFSFSLILLLLSNSKTALLSFVILLAAICTYRTLQRRYDVMLPAFIAIAVVGASLFLRLTVNLDAVPSVPTTAPSIPTAVPNLIDKGGTLNARAQLWSLVWEMIWKRPWLGYGYSGFWLGWNGESGYIWRVTDWMPPNSHNGLLDLWLDLGVLGVSIYLIGFWKALVRGLVWMRLSRTSEGLWPVTYMTCLVLANLAESTLVIQNNIFWVLYISVAVSLVRPLERQIAKTKQVGPLKIVMLGASLGQNGGIATLEKLVLKHAPSDIEIQHITSHDEGSIAHRVIVFGKALGALLWRLLLRKTDLVHLHLSDGGSVLRKAILTLTAFMFRKPVLIHANGAEFHLTYVRLPRWAQQGLSGIFRRCNGFIAVTSLWKDFYVTNLCLNEKQAFVLPNPTELPQQVPNRVNSPRVRLVFCGRVGQRKGTFDLIQAYANLPTKLKKCSELIIAGDGEIEQGRKSVESLNLTNYVTFLGWIDAQQRDALLAKADVFILPSYNEGLPLALVEAMGWGLPVITTPVSGIPELVTSTENGLLVTPGDIQQLSEAMQSLIENEALRLFLGSAARKTVAPLDVKTFYCRLDNIYRQCFNQMGLALHENKHQWRQG